MLRIPTVAIEQVGSLHVFALAFLTAAEHTTVLSGQTLVAAHMVEV